MFPTIVPALLRPVTALHGKPGAAPRSVMVVPSQVKAWTFSSLGTSDDKPGVIDQRRRAVAAAQRAQLANRAAREHERAPASACREVADDISACVESLRHGSTGIAEQQVVNRPVVDPRPIRSRIAEHAA